MGTYLVLGMEGILCKKEHFNHVSLFVQSELIGHYFLPSEKKPPPLTCNYGMSNPVMPECVHRYVLLIWGYESWTGKSSTSNSQSITVAVVHYLC